MDSINENIATVLAAIITLGLALRAGVGPVVMYLTEAVKDAFKLPDGWGGITSVVVGMILGVALGGLTASATPDSPLFTFMAFGALAGLFMAAGAIETHKAAGQVNPEAGAAVNVEEANTVNSTPFPPGSYSYGYYPAYSEELEEPSVDFSGVIIEDGEEDTSGPLAEWDVYRAAGGHTGDAVEVEPIEDLPEPSDRYRGRPDEINGE